MAYEDSDYEIFYDEIVDNVRITKFRMKKNGAVGICRDPIHTPEEQAIISSNFAKAAARIVFPDVDLSRVKSITVICNDQLPAGTEVE